MIIEKDQKPMNTNSTLQKALASPNHASRAIWRVSARRAALGLLLLAAFILLAGCGGDDSSSKKAKKGGGGGAPPAVFSVTTPANNPAYTNSGADITLSGGCVDGDTVAIAGDISPASVTCAGGAYSFTLPGAADATYQYFVSNTDALANVTVINFSLIRDSVAPAVVSITSPISSPVVSSDADLLIWGTCENDAVVTLDEVDGGGAVLASQSTVCAGTVYSLSVNRPGTANYKFLLTQVDQAGNASLSLDQLWVQDNSVPATPVITSPAGTPYYSNAAPLIVSGTCTDTSAHTVTLDDGGASPPTQSCAAASFSFNLGTPAGDGNYTNLITQADDIALLDSAAAVFQWVYDTTPPADPVILSPASPFTAPDPLFLSGSCEEGDGVDLLTNPGGVVLQSTTCSGGSFVFTVSEGSDGVYTYDVSQSDLAGNASLGVATLIWTRNSAAVPPPTITSQAVNPYLSNGNTLNLFGACLTGYTVTLGGDASATTTCAGGVYTFSIDKSADVVDLSYTFNVTQDDGIGGPVSDPVSLVWNRDITPPVLTVSFSPLDPNPSKESRFEFSASEPGSTFQCNLNGAGTTSCASPASYFGLPSGPVNSFDIQAVDLAGNLTAVQSFSWTQNANDAVLLYHLDDADPLADSSLYAGVFDNPLAADLVSATGVAGFGEGRLFDGVSDFMSAPDNAKHASLQSLMTVEAFVKFNALPPNGSKMSFVSKNDGLSDIGWEFGIKPQGGSGKYTLYFEGSLDGVTLSATKSARLNAVNLGQFYHVAVTWNLGLVTYYFDGVQVGQKTIGTLGAAVLWDSTQPLRLGSGNGGDGFLDGVMDEVRVSQTERYLAGFTPPAAPFVAD